jgi:hypothetical protein
LGPFPTNYLQLVASSFVDITASSDDKDDFVLILLLMSYQNLVSKVSAHFSPFGGFGRQNSAAGRPKTFFPRVPSRSVVLDSSPAMNPTGLPVFPGGLPVAYQGDPAAAAVQQQVAQAAAAAFQGQAGV